MQSFEFMTATRIVFGAGALDKIPALVVELGRRALVVTGLKLERAERLFTLLDGSGMAYTAFSVRGEPTITDIERGVEVARSTGCDIVVSYGGGSAIDAGKAIAALATNPGEPLDYLEVIGKNQPLSVPPLPFVAIPTTAGTGSEVTRNAVLSSAEHRMKVSLRSPLMLPNLALIDPELTYPLPTSVTASTGMDALTQVIEPLVCSTPNPITDALCREGIQRAARSLAQAVAQPDDADARADMALASLLGGLALANARLGIVHGIAGPLGGMFPIPHGVICAALLPHATAVNIEALRARDPESAALQRYGDVARLLTGQPDATPEDGAAWLLALYQGLPLTSLAQFGVTAADFPPLVERAERASSTRGNPIVLTSAEITEILTRAV
ncbi:MAG: iron-containing alcohol dehydrogenase [Armatimonadetes bacterium]|nr:iron-containing alcohol dehydrogenase [Anaerolineae bacterium]